MNREPIQPELIQRQAIQPGQLERPLIDAAAPLIQPTALVDAGATLGADTWVWHFAHVCAGARIGTGCSLGQNVHVGSDVHIGDRVNIHNNVSVNDAVTLEDEVYCGPGMVFTNPVNPRAVPTSMEPYRRTLVRRGATLGANSTIACGVTIGAHACIEAGAVVTGDVPAFARMTGVPARQSGWVSRHGDALKLPLEGSGQAQCPHTGDIYAVLDGICTLFVARYRQADPRS